MIVGEQPLGEVLAHVAHLAVKVIPGARDASVTIIERESPRSVAFFGPLAVALDERQYEAGFGPCMDAAVSGQVRTIEDTNQDAVYPDFARLAQRHGIGQVVAIGFPTVQQMGGALNMYGGGQGAFDADARALAAVFADYAAVAVLNAARYAATVEEVVQMRQAMSSRASIEQAKGILMRELGCSPEEAFDILRSRSSAGNRKLRDIAAVIIARTRKR
jgi:GAF domain-containing protein